MSSLYIEKIRAAIAPLREKIVAHPVYAWIEDMPAMRQFMRHHVYAVWDFMSLLKSLQRELTCVELPWFPKGSAQTRYLINEIVLGEESDEDQRGRKVSHFELYLDAMREAGADMAEMEHFSAVLQAGHGLEAAFEQAGTPAAAREFVRYTFEVINSSKAHVQAAVFTFGREDLIPNMFMSIVNDLHAANPAQIGIFKYYLERHIEVDGDHHSHLALEMTTELCGQDAARWAEAEAAVVAALERRLGLWDGVYAAVMAERELAN